MLKVTIPDPPSGMHPEQSFEDAKHLTSWIKEQTDSGKIVSGKASKTKLDLVIPDQTEEGRKVSCTITEE